MSIRRRSIPAAVGLALAPWIAAQQGCASKPAESPADSGPVMWPMPPELPRYMYEATLRNAASLGDPPDALALQRLLGGADLTRAGFGKPFGVAARNGRIYVADTEGRRIFVFDLPRRRTFGFGLRLEGELKKPVGIATDASGTVYVVDATARRLVLYDALGLFLREIPGSADWVRPTAVAVSEDGRRIHVVDTGGVASNSHRVFTYGADGTLLRKLGRRGDAPGAFNLPADAAVGPDGTLWVLDAGNFRVQGFDPDGRPTIQFGSVGNGLGQFARPRGIAVDGDGNIYVSDAAFCNVQVFRPDGQLLLPLGSRAKDKDAPGRFLLPARLATDHTNRLYVVDQFLHKIEVIRRLGDEEGRRIMLEPMG